MSALLPGLLTGLTLIIAIGAQNAFVLRQGVTRERIGAVVAICAVSDVVLILAGVAGIGTLITQAGWLLDLVRWLGVTFLVWYGATALLRAQRPGALTPGAPASNPGNHPSNHPSHDRTPSRRVLLTALGLTWLNPHVYLDTVLLLGSIASTHGMVGRWWFAAGAATASVLWFVCLGFGARLLAPWLARPGAWRALDVVIGVTMWVIAARLAIA